MSAKFQAVQWNRYKRRFDACLWAAIAVYLAVFLGLGFAFIEQADETVLLIRAFGSAAYLLLHLTLCIGPLARLDTRFLPLLYNRRHLGVSLFLLGLTHAFLAIFHYHSFGDLPWLVSLLSSSSPHEAPFGVPFEAFGALALLLLAALAFTSHDFWLRQLRPPVWKALHRGIYLAFALLVAHVGFGLLQQEPALAVFVVCAAAGVVALHAFAARREKPPLQADVDPARGASADMSLGASADYAALPDGTARIVESQGQRIAIFRDGETLCAVSNVCRHQNGPLGEGRIVRGLITCPWHGYQYRAADGCSPPPFTDRIHTYRLRIADGQLWLDPKPKQLGEHSEPVHLGAAAQPPASGEGRA